MKKIINRRTGKHIEDPYEARVLIRDVKRVYPFVQSDEHLAPHGRTSAFIAEKDLPAIREAHAGYICVFDGTFNCGFAGVKALYMGFKSLPEDFEARFPDYVVVGG